jgi:hypothetical protein
LLLDDGNRETVDGLRRVGRRVAEFIKLAVQDNANGKRVLYHLFRAAYEHARMIFKVTDILIEVNPRHASFYQQVFGFAVAGAERICPRVNAPAVLLRLDLAELDERHGVNAEAPAVRLESEGPLDLLFRLRMPWLASDNPALTPAPG